MEFQGVPFFYQEVQGEAGFLNVNAWRINRVYPRFTHLLPLQGLLHYYTRRRPLLHTWFLQGQRLGGLSSTPVGGGVLIFSISEVTVTPGHLYLWTFIFFFTYLFYLCLNLFSMYVSAQIVLIYTKFVPNAAPPHFKSDFHEKKKKKHAGESPS